MHSRMKEKKYADASKLSICFCNKEHWSIYNGGKTETDVSPSNHKRLNLPRNAILNTLYVGLLFFCGIMHSWHP